MNAIYGLLFAGLTSAADFEVRIQRDKFILRSQGRYTLVRWHTRHAI